MLSAHRVILEIFYSNIKKIASQNVSLAAVFVCLYYKPALETCSFMKEDPETFLRSASLYEKAK